jgi:hypothetical protein
MRQVHLAVANQRDHSSILLKYSSRALTVNLDNRNFHRRVVEASDPIGLGVMIGRCSGRRTYPLFSIRPQYWDERGFPQPQPLSARSS